MQSVAGDGDSRILNDMPRFGGSIELGKKSERRKLVARQA